MSILPPSNTSLKATATNHWQNLQAEAQRRAAEQAARDADPVERAVRYIRSRGRVIFRASVHGGPEDRWKHAGQLLDADAVIALAESIQRLSGQIKAVPPSSPVPVSIAPIRTSPARRKAVKAQPSTPAASATAIQEAPMPNPHIHTAQPAKKPAPLPSQDHWASERGTTAAAVRKDLADLKAVLGPAALANRLNTGKSSVNNVLLGHNTVGPTILAALYGESGCTLKPSLAALLAAPTNPVEPANQAGVEVAGPASSKDAVTETKAEAIEPPNVTAPQHVDPQLDPAYVPVVASMVMSELMASEVADQPQETNWAETARAVREAVGAERKFHVLELSPELATINVSDLLAAARRQREQLQAELADIDTQIRAVLKLAGMAA